MAKANTKELVGIIGQMYEDRRNGDSGRLISRDEKCKTLSFESENGKTFVKSYSHFKSYMRKKADVAPEEVKEEAYAEAELTKVEVSEADAEKMIKNAKRKENKAKKEADEKAKAEKPAKKPKELSTFYADAVTLVTGYIESFSNPNLSFAVEPKKRVCKIKHLGDVVLHLWCKSRTNEYSFWLRENEFDALDKSDFNGYKVVRHDGGYARNIEITMTEGVNDFLEKLRPVIIETLVNSKKEAV